MSELSSLLKQVPQGEWAKCRHATPEYAPQFGVYPTVGSPADFALIRGDNAEAIADLLVRAPKVAACLIETVAALEDAKQSLAVAFDRIAAENDDQEFIDDMDEALGKARAALANSREAIN